MIRQIIKEDSGFYARSYFISLILKFTSANDLQRLEGLSDLTGRRRNM